MDNDPDVVKNARAGKLDVGFTKNVADVMSLQKMDHMRVIPVDIPYTRILWINQYPMK
jgi:peptide/nickel transport system substrate-binding protein